MNDFLSYILKSAFCLSLMHLAFRTVMRKEAFFALNRMVLIAIVFFSFIIPLLYLPSTIKPTIKEQIIPQVSFYKIDAQPTTAVEIDKTTISVPSPAAVQKGKTLHYSASQIILIIYLSGVLFSILVFIYGIIDILLMLRKAMAIRKDGYLVFILKKNMPAFSFCKMIFISRADYEKHGKTILTHEIQHIRLGHFYDLMLMELAKMVHWFNPIIYWLIQDIKAIHEFQADQHTLTSGIDATNYQLLIIEKGVGSQRFALANSFNHCQIKKRITMMNKQKTSKAGIWKVATFLPLLALLLMAFGREGENVQKDSPSIKEMLNPEKTIVTEPAAQSKDSIYSITEVLPEFPGGDQALRKYIANNIKYPPTAAAKRIQGKVFVSYIITSEGTVTNPKVVRGVDPELDAEALRLVSLMPKWIPAKEKGKNVSMSYTLPIIFVLYPGASGKNVQANSPAESKLNQGKPNEEESSKQVNDPVYTIVDVMPQFPDGERALRKFLKENMKYPKEATAKHIQGKVFVSYIVNKEGKILNPKVVRGVSPLLDAEALRVVKLMPNWVPGKNKGKIVSVSYTLPLNFVLE